MLLREIKKYNSLVLRLLVLLVTLYAFTIPFGTVFKPEGEMSPQPLINLAFLTYAILLLGLIAVLLTNNIKSNSIINCLFLLTLYLFFNTLLFSENILDNLGKWISFFANVLLVYFISNIKFKKTFLRTFFFILSLGALIASTITLIDQFNIINVPYFNESTIGVIGFNVRGVSGSFQSRTTMGAFYSIVMPIALFSFLTYKRPFYLIAFATAFIAMVSTFNRGAPFALIIVAVIFYIRKYNRNIKIILFSLVIGVVLAFVLFNTFSYDQRNVIKYLVLTSLNVIEKEDKLADSDNFRIDALQQIITEEIKKNPFGHGFNNFYLKGNSEPISVHSNLNYIIYIAGIFGFLWLIFFVRKLYIVTHTISDKDLNIIKYSLFSWVLYSLTHMVINTFLAWLLLGLLFNKYINSEMDISLKYPIKRGIDV